MLEYRDFEAFTNQVLDDPAADETEPTCDEDLAQDATSLCFVTKAFVAVRKRCMIFIGPTVIVT